MRSCHFQVKVCAHRTLWWRAQNNKEIFKCTAVRSCKDFSNKLQYEYNRTSTCLVVQSLAVQWRSIAWLMCTNTHITYVFTTAPFIIEWCIPPRGTEAEHCVGTTWISLSGMWVHVLALDHVTWYDGYSINCWMKNRIPKGRLTYTTDDICITSGHCYCLDNEYVPSLIKNDPSKATPFGGSFLISEAVLPTQGVRTQVPAKSTWGPTN